MECDCNITRTVDEIPADGESTETSGEFGVLTDENLVSFGVLLLLTLMLAGLVTGYVVRVQRVKFLHEAGAILLFGAAVGAIIRFGVGIKRLQDMMTLDSNFFFLFILPPIIFESGYNMKFRHFFKNIGGILVYAFVGTTIATFLTGGLLYLTVVAGLAEASLLECLLFGALISATDPVTVLAIFKEIKVDPDLYNNIFGESVLNDAVAIVLFRTLLTFEHRDVTALACAQAIGQFVLLFVGSLVAGVIVGVLSSLFFKHLRHMSKYGTMECAILMLFAYSAYLLASAIGLSGIVAILFCGVTMSHYTYRNLSHSSQHLTSELIEIVALLCETLVFVYLGLAVFAYPLHEGFQIAFIVAAVLGCIVSRIAHVFPLSLLVNTWRNPGNKIKTSEMVFISFAGLRGAMAFALAVSVPTTLNRPLLELTTLVIVFFTILLCGGTTVPLIEKLGIPYGVDPDVAAVDESIVDIDEAPWFDRFDRRYLLPFLTRPPPEVDRDTVLGLEMEEIDVADEPAGVIHTGDGHSHQFDSSLVVDSPAEAAEVAATEPPLRSRSGTFNMSSSPRRDLSALEHHSGGSGPPSLKSSTTVPDGHGHIEHDREGLTRSAGQAFGLPSSHQSPSSGHEST